MENSNAASNFKGSKQIKRIRVWENGDFNGSGHVLVINPKFYRSWNCILSFVTNSIRPSFGIVKHLINLKNKDFARSFDSLEPNGKYVALGTEKLKLYKNCYQTIKEKQQQSEVTELVEYFSQPSTSTDNGRTMIFVLANGRKQEMPCKVILTDFDAKSWNSILELIARKLDIPSGIRYLCSIFGDAIRDPKSLQNGSVYIAVPANRQFVDLDYVKIFKNMLPMREVDLKRIEITAELPQQINDPIVLNVMCNQGYNVARNHGNIVNGNNCQNSDNKRRRIEAAAVSCSKPISEAKCSGSKGKRSIHEEQNRTPNAIQQKQPANCGLSRETTQILSQTESCEKCPSDCVESDLVYCYPQNCPLESKKLHLICKKPPPKCQSTDGKKKASNIPKKVSKIVIKQNDAAYNNFNKGCNQASINKLSFVPPDSAERTLEEEIECQKYLGGQCQAAARASRSMKDFQKCSKPNLQDACCYSMDKVQEIRKPSKSKASCAPLKHLFSKKKVEKSQEEECTDCDVQLLENRSSCQTVEQKGNATCSSKSKENVGGNATVHIEDIKQLLCQECSKKIEIESKKMDIDTKATSSGKNEIADNLGGCGKRDNIIDCPRKINVERELVQGASFPRITMTKCPFNISIDNEKAEATYKMANSGAVNISTSSQPTLPTEQKQTKPAQCCSQPELYCDATSCKLKDKKQCTQSNCQNDECELRNRLTTSCQCVSPFCSSVQINTNELDFGSPPVYDDIFCCADSRPVQKIPKKQQSKKVGCFNFKTNKKSVSKQNKGTCSSEAKTPCKDVAVETGNDKGNEDCSCDNEVKGPCCFSSKVMKIETIFCKNISVQKSQSYCTDKATISQVNQIQRKCAENCQILYKNESQAVNVSENFTKPSVVPEESLGLSKDKPKSSLKVHQLVKPESFQTKHLEIKVPRNQKFNLELGQNLDPNSSPMPSDLSDFFSYTNTSEENESKLIPFQENKDLSSETPSIGEASLLDNSIENHIVTQQSSFSSIAGSSIRKQPDIKFPLFNNGDMDSSNITKEELQQISSGFYEQTSTTENFLVGSVESGNVKTKPKEMCPICVVSEIKCFMTPEERKTKETQKKPDHCTDSFVPPEKIKCPSKSICPPVSQQTSVCRSFEKVQKCKQDLSKPICPTLKKVATSKAVPKCQMVSSNEFKERKQADTNFAMSKNVPKCQMVSSNEFREQKQGVLSKNLPKCQMVASNEFRKQKQADTNFAMSKNVPKCQMVSSNEFKQQNRAETKQFQTDGNDNNNTTETRRKEVLKSPREPRCPDRMGKTADFGSCCPCPKANKTTSVGNIEYYQSEFAKKYDLSSVETDDEQEEEEKIMVPPKNPSREGPCVTTTEYSSKLGITISELYKDDPKPICMSASTSIDGKNANKESLEMQSASTQMALPSPISIVNPLSKHRVSIILDAGQPTVYMYSSESEQSVAKQKNGAMIFEQFRPEPASALPSIETVKLLKEKEEEDATDECDALTPLAKCYCKEKSCKCKFNCLGKRLSAMDQNGETNDLKETKKPPHLSEQSLKSTGSSLSGLIVGESSSSYNGPVKPTDSENQPLSDNPNDLIEVINTRRSQQKKESLFTVRSEDEENNEDD